MRILGLDVGTKTVGVAMSDEMGWTAQGLETIRINEERGHFGFDRISELVKQYNVDKIVVGLPKNMNGTIGPRGEACQQFAENLRNLLQLEVVMWDERLSTMAAERLLISADVSRKKRKQVIDKMAAVVILQGFLDSK
ncbi:Holliday junction resolvase RuvX [Bacillus mycoides]|jgi:putative Holliday junction resolvase|uniref:Putative pre-16S rRNA nuclease n=13 Tax=Bacillus TaxID=1386 RepID=YQGF_BACMK|nr:MULTISPECIES: Holliday junction resolvase RuvX [Bacillus]A9VI07.1 RecName: Full=Putative pre-16S rRNA nuclease [Bacillus mycoides KBAB4]AYF08390.1 Holliday junction resolvase RuvX [Bacillus mobilis]AZJ22476.1 Holliday junction resolvase RuvX [Bacillus wiedmannii bv. thuringiensis]EEL04287.1 Holliday junction resolvase [Bacillus cereus BDRD-ST196]EEL80275.1 Holliday junction resolvase [Bacillus cereus AH1271]EJQ49069.1 RNAse H-fold protein YqgF [Bacillus cereus BAG6X1-2]EJQ67517.1 RNAse H-